ncbi:intraflagellar transport 43 isoform X1 [Haemaphysalis longicornis]
MDADDLDDLESPVKKTVTSRARRLSIFGNSSADVPTNAFASNGGGDSSRAPPKPRRNSGWAEDNSSSGLFRFRRPSARPQSTAPIEVPRTTKNETVLERDDSDTEIPTIPDLGEVEREDLTTQIAQAPSVSVNQVDTFQQLDSELLKQAAFTTLDGCDLRLLTKYLTPEEYLKEPDVVWTWDTLFTEVSNEINKTNDAAQEVDDKQNVLP